MNEPNQVMGRKLPIEQVEFKMNRARRVNTVKIQIKLIQ